MVHELLTINNNQVDLSHIEDIKPDLHKVLLCAEQDDLYKQVNVNTLIRNILKIVLLISLQIFLEYI